MNETNEQGEVVYRLTGAYTLSHLQDLEVVLIRRTTEALWKPFYEDIRRAIGNTNGQRCRTCHRLLSHEDLLRYLDSESQQGYQNGWYCSLHEKRPEFQHPHRSKEGKEKK